MNAIVKLLSRVNVNGYRNDIKSIQWKINEFRYMNLLDTTSLGNTIDNVSEALLFGFDISGNEKSAIASFLTERHFTSGAYANMFAPTELVLS